jgi:hypothetical protein
LALLSAALASAGDPVAALSSTPLAFDRTYGYLPALLEALHVPIDSQIAVFSKTSIQSLRIEPSNPRVLYFNDSVAVGWVRGGFIELAAQDPTQGIRFYALQQRPGEQIARREDCLNCHKSGRTLLRSVTTAADGIPMGEIDTDNRTPLDKLWGGWFVTGDTGPVATLGNAVFANSARHELAPSLDPRGSLTWSSDIVALMVFAHQMRVMNLLAHPDNANELADALLFVDEAPLPGPIQGSSGFAEAFSATGPRDHLGRSLRQFDLQRRLMRYPCSYMIYSEAFDGLPPGTKAAVYRRMWSVLSSEKKVDREAVVEILRDTKPDLPSYFTASRRRERGKAAPPPASRRGGAAPA